MLVAWVQCTFNFRGETEGSYFTIYWKGRVMIQYEATGIFIAGEGNYYWSEKGGLKRERFYGNA